MLHIERAEQWGLDAAGGKGGRRIDEGQELGAALAGFAEADHDAAVYDKGRHARRPEACLTGHSGQRVASFRVTVDVTIGEFQVGACGRQLGQIILCGAAMRATIANEYDECTRGYRLLRRVGPRVAIGQAGRGAENEKKAERQL